MSRLSNVQQGGRAFLAELGLKGGVRKPRIGIFGFIGPGIVWFSRVGELNSLATQGRTSFLADLGGTFEAYPSRRAILFVEIGVPLIMFAERTKALSGGATAIAPGSVQSSLQVSTGIRLRLGEVSNAVMEESAHLKKYEVGVLFSGLSLQRFLDTLRHEPGAGVRGSYNLTNHWSLDSEMDYFPRSPRAISAQEGGKILLGLLGPKVGIRRRKAGLFAKLRPGFLHYSKTLADESDVLNPRYSSLTDVALDIGGVVEVYPTPRATVLRFDVGDIVVWHGSRIVSGLLSPEFVEHSLQVSSGFGFRF